MRPRTALVLSALLLLTASLAGAAVPPAPAAPASSLAASPLDPGCDPLLAELGIAPDSAQAQKDAIALTCGACSVAICRGAGFNSICQGGTQVKKCIPAYGNSCSDGTWQCQCWSGPLP